MGIKIDSKIKVESKIKMESPTFVSPVSVLLDCPENCANRVILWRGGDYSSYSLPECSIGKVPKGYEIIDHTNFSVVLRRVLCPYYKKSK